MRFSDAVAFAERHPSQAGCCTWGSFKLQGRSEDALSIGQRMLPSTNEYLKRTSRKSFSCKSMGLQESGELREPRGGLGSSWRNL